MKQFLVVFFFQIVMNTFSTFLVIIHLKAGDLILEKSEDGLNVRRCFCVQSVE